jgi:hypothetical protein
VYNCGEVKDEQRKCFHRVTAQCFIQPAA